MTTIDDVMTLRASDYQKELQLYFKKTYENQT